MKKMMLASHGSLAKGMKSAIRMIVGDVSRIDDYNLDELETPTRIRQEIETKLRENPTDEFIIITDIKGGSVFNELTKLCVYPNIVLISVMSLPLVLEMTIMLNRSESAKEIASIAMSLALKTWEILDAEKLQELLCEGKEDVCW